MKRFFTIATIALSFISCGENGGLIPEPTPPVERIPINISTSITRATDSAFEAGDKVGIFVVNEPNTLAASGNYVDNMGFTYAVLDDYLIRGVTPPADVLNNIMNRHLRNQHKEAINLPHPRARTRPYVYRNDGFEF